MPTGCYSNPVPPTYKVIDLSVYKPARRAVNNVVFFGISDKWLDVNTGVGDLVCAEIMAILSVGGWTDGQTHVKMASFRTAQCTCHVTDTVIVISNREKVNKILTNVRTLLSIPLIMHSRIALWEVRRLCPFVLPVGAVCR
jgi:hypothetical protein